MVIIVTFKNNKTRSFKNFQKLFISDKYKVLDEIVILDCYSNRTRVIPAEIQFLTSLQEFYCSDNKISVIPPEIQFLTNLRVFNCSGNQITVIPPEIRFLTNLQEFSCSGNQIEVLPSEIQFLTNLQVFQCTNNQIQVIPLEIRFLTGLQEFHCNDNQIQVIPPEIQFLTNLRRFYCNRNQIQVIPPEIQYLTNLQRFICNFNQIQVIPPEIQFLTNLQKFYCSINRITRIPFEITYCRQLQDFNYSSNPMNILNPAVERFVNRLRNYNSRGKFTIYTDSQSVHNSAIQSSIKESIITILNKWTEKVSEEKILDHLLKNELITTQSQLLEYFIDNTVHSIVGVTFKELFLIIYNRLVTDNSIEVFKILNQEMKDSECKCFTGRLNRLVSSLSGFYPEVKVSISKSDEISNVVSVMKKKFSDITTLKQKVSEELLSRGYLERDFEDWIESIE